MASETRSWNTTDVVYDAATGGATLGPLKTVEMERQMGLDDDYTISLDYQRRYVILYLQGF